MNMKLKVELHIWAAYFSFQSVLWIIAAEDCSKVTAVILDKGQIKSGAEKLFRFVS